MFGEPSKNTTWNVAAPMPEKCGTSRYSTTSLRLGAVPTTSNLIALVVVGSMSSQNGATIVDAVVVGSGVLLNAVTGPLKLSRPLLPTLTVMKPGSEPANRIGNGEVNDAEQSSQISGSAVPVIVS